MLTRLRNDEGGFGLLELLMSMTILNIGILAMVAAFNSGAVALQRANKIATASAIADAQMEQYRAIKYTAIGLDSTALTAAQANTRYTGDPAYSSTQVTLSCPLDTDGKPYECNPKREEAGPDGKAYRIDTYIVEQAPTAGTSRNLKVITVVVRDRVDLSKTLVRQQSTFDASTGS